MGVIEYKASPTLWRFHQSGASVRGLIGPFGSGKSVGCCVEIMTRCTHQRPGPDGLRRSRWLVARNSYRELQDTTIKTWRDWFPAEMGRWHESRMTQELIIGDVRAEILFRSLDSPDDVKKLLSLELTGAWLNEAREIPYAIVKAIRGRLGRYPARRDGGASWYGLIMDTNPPDEDHWWYRVFEEERPAGWEVFHQPSGLSPEAENRENLPPTYYEDMMQGADEDWIRVYVHGEYGFVRDGKPMYPEYQDHVHAAEQILPYVPDLPLYLGLDFGLTPAATFAQRHPDGQWQFVDELVTDDMGAERFGEQLHEKLQDEYREATEAGLTITGDPSGSIRAQTDETTVFAILEAQGIRAAPAFTNDPEVRHDAVAGAMRTLTMTGRPGLQVSPKCRMLRKGWAGGYCLRRLRVVGEDRYADRPDKNIYSHVCESAEYLMLGAGEGDRVLGAGEHRPRHRPCVKIRGGLRARP